MKAIISLFTVLVLTLGLSACTTYQSVKVKSHHPDVQVSFSAAERQTIKGYYLYHRDWRPLPPGHKKRYIRNYKRYHQLPGHIAYKALPYGIEKRLRRLPRNYVRIRIGDDIAIMNTKTRVIYDLMWIFE